MSSEEDFFNFAKTFRGTWTFVSDENMEAFLTEQGSPVDSIAVKVIKTPKLTFYTENNTITSIVEIMPEVTFEKVFKLGETFNVQDREDNPRLLLEMYGFMEDLDFHTTVQCLAPVDCKQYKTITSVHKEELTVKFILGDIIGKRIYKKVYYF